MFGKKKESKVKQPSPRVIMIDGIADAVAQLGPEENLHDKVPELYWTEFWAFPTCALTLSYPEKSRKYISATGYGLTCT